MCAKKDNGTIDLDNARTEPRIMMITTLKVVRALVRSYGMIITTLMMINSRVDSNGCS
jgi:hypothetical protein